MVAKTPSILPRSILDDSWGSGFIALWESNDIFFLYKSHKTGGPRETVFYGL